MHPEIAAFVWLGKGLLKKTYLNSTVSKTVLVIYAVAKLGAIAMAIIISSTETSSGKAKMLTVSR
ncbi:hypothetical protein WKK05_09530 [Nostoc sp. UHCC 0302]|uniref:hypothetical protein n=1 Tax=Nostoc sp. UHCC 0302 TaxID=3134896 RepID=UPI00311CA12D